MKKIFAVIVIIGVIVIFAASVTYKISKERELDLRRAITSVHEGTPRYPQSHVRSIPIRSCSGEGELYLYESDDPFGPIETEFDINRNQLLVFASKEAEVSVTVDGHSATLDTLSFTDGRMRILRDVDHGSTIGISGSHDHGARGVNGFIAQDSTRPVYDINTFQFIYNDNKENVMFLTPGEYSYVFFDKYTIGAPGGGIDTRLLTVKVEGNNGVLVDRTYDQPFPDGIQGAVVGDYFVEQQGNYTLSLNTEDSIYWALVECPICGNNEVEKGEECDEGDDNGKKCIADYNDDCSYCSENCEYITIKGPYCGDGNLESQYEECDEGSLNGQKCTPTYGQSCTYCTEICEEETIMGSVCGDGILNSGEECDDGNNINGDGCSANCEKPETCDDQCTLSIGCDGGYSCYQDHCRNDACLSEVDCICPSCGDGVLDPSEECDDGNNISGDGCSADCMIEEEEEEEEEEEKGDCDGSIGNYVWNDINGDGVQDANEQGLAKVDMKLTWAGSDDKFGNSDDEVFRDKTSSKGKYKFEDLCKGKYRVRVKDTDVEGHIQTYDPDGKKDNKTNVRLKNNHDDHTKADFGYRALKVAPASGVGIMIILLISATLTIMVLAGLFLTRRMRYLSR
ncbi:MAG: SdrD B-like domain-containing protein [Patescibacteria group bacterium]|nr:SdrD B-like domain-containing protein [Patescibacteria group bacterium]